MYHSLIEGLRRNAYLRDSTFSGTSLAPSLCALTYCKEWGQWYHLKQFQIKRDHEVIRFSDVKNVKIFASTPRNRKTQRKEVAPRHEVVCRIARFILGGNITQWQTMKFSQPKNILRKWRRFLLVKPCPIPHCFIRKALVGFRVRTELVITRLYRFSLHFRPYVLSVGMCHFARITPATIGYSPATFRSLASTGREFPARCRTLKLLIGCCTQLSPPKGYQTIFIYDQTV